jgi:hypothetical protein
MKTLDKQRQLKTLWQPANRQANLLVDSWVNKLDKRKSSLKDHDKNKHVLSAFLAYREGPFEVLLSNSDKCDRNTLRDVTDALLGDVLHRTKGTTGFKFNPKIILPVTKVQTINATLRNTITTRLGAIYRDESYKERLVEDLHAIGQSKIGLIKISEPFANMALLSQQLDNAPRNWLNLDGLVKSGPEEERLWAEFQERIEESAFRQAITCYPMAETGLFLTSQVERLAKLIQQTATRQFGVPRISPSMLLTDKYGKKSKIWGTCPPKPTTIINNNTTHEAIL